MRSGRAGGRHYPLPNLFFKCCAVPTAWSEPLITMPIRWQSASASSIECVVSTTAASLASTAAHHSTPVCRSTARHFATVRTPVECAGTSAPKHRRPVNPRRTHTARRLRGCEPGSNSARWSDGAAWPICPAAHRRHARSLSHAQPVKQHAIYSEANNVRRHCNGPARPPIVAEMRSHM